MDVNSITPDQTLDTKGLSCPMPLLKAKKAVGQLGSGQIIEIQGTDPGSKNDMPAWCEREGHEFLGIKDGDGFFSVFLKKA